IMTIALRATAGEAGGLAPRARHPAHPWVVATAALGFVVILFGAQVANFHAGLLCLGLPFCGGTLLPPQPWPARLHWEPRALAYPCALVVVALVAYLRQRRDPAAAGLRRAATIVLGLTLLQIAVAVAMVVHLLPPTLRAAHLLAGTAVWAGLVALVFVSARTA